MVLKNIEELKLYLNTQRNIIIIGHRNPDGDAIGSTLGLKYYLDKKGHNVQVMMPNDYPDFLKWLKGSEDILLFDRDNQKCLDTINSSDIIFLLDFNALHRLGDDMKIVLEKYEKDFVLIDHHQQPDEFKYMYSDTAMCSTCQMVYHFIEMLEDVELIDKTIATSLYTGIMTDTGSFAFRSTTSKTHRVVAELIDKGAENDRIHSNTFNMNSVGTLHLLGQALNNLKVLPEYHTAFITLSQEEKERYNCQKGDTTGIVNYALSVKDVYFAVIFIQEQDMIKISFRSLGKFSVNQFARNHFEGGGHDNASGGKSLLSMEETIDKFIRLLPQYKLELEKSYEV